MTGPRRRIWPRPARRARRRWLRAGLACALGVGLGSAAARAQAQAAASKASAAAGARPAAAAPGRRASGAAPSAVGKASTAPAAASASSPRATAPSVGPAANAPAGPNGRLLAVRLWPAPDYTRLTLESDRALTATHMLREGGLAPRLLLAVKGLSNPQALGEAAAKLRPEDPFVADLSVEVQPDGTALLALRLKQGVRPQQFMLTPVAAYQHRLVLDLYPLKEADPLLALLREKRLDGESQAAADVNDALGAFIGQLKPASGAAATAQAASAARSPGRSAQAPAGGMGGMAGMGGSTATTKSRDKPLWVVTLDPGHGGEDPGAIGPTGLREKDVVLAVARALRERLAQHPQVRVALTRDADFFVPLQQRVRKAQQLRSDLFVSIHADAFTNPEARGASVFALSNRGATSTMARLMAQKENAADQVGGMPVARRDPSLLAMLLDMSTAAQIKDSLKLGEEVLQRVGRVGRLHKPRVEQAAFAVLRAPQIPSILVETAFISNPEEEQRLRDPEYQAALVEALATGILRYLERSVQRAPQA